MRRAVRDVTLERIADAAGVSRATVDRVMNERPGVQSHTRQHVLSVAGRLRSGADPDPDPGRGPVSGPCEPARSSRRLGIVVPDGDNAFLAELVDRLRRHADARGDVALDVRAVAALSPEASALALDDLAAACDGVAIVGIDAPSVREAVRRAVVAGVPVVTLVSDIAQVERVSYVGIDNRAAGRLAGQLIGRFVSTDSAAVALVPGSLAYRGHAEREAGFRHVLREHFPGLHIVAVPEIDEDDARANAALTDVLQEHPGLAAVYCIGAGQAGVVRALEAAGRELDTVLVAHELTDRTRGWLLSGVMDATIDQNARVEAREAIDRLMQAIAGDVPVASRTIRIQPVFRENMPSDG